MPRLRIWMSFWGFWQSFHSRQLVYFSTKWVEKENQNWYIDFIREDRGNEAVK